MELFKLKTFWLLAGLVTVLIVVAALLGYIPQTVFWWLTPIWWPGMLTIYVILAGFFTGAVVSIKRRKTRREMERRLRDEAVFESYVDSVISEQKKGQVVLWVLLIGTAIILGCIIVKIFSELN